MLPTWVPPMACPLPAPPEAKQNSHLTCDPELPGEAAQCGLEAGSGTRSESGFTFSFVFSRNDRETKKKAITSSVLHSLSLSACLHQPQLGTGTCWHRLPQGPYL